jgi:hypothetical protein
MLETYEGVNVQPSTFGKVEFNIGLKLFEFSIGFKLDLEMCRFQLGQLIIF